MAKNSVDVELKLHEDGQSATVTLSGQSRPIVAPVLAVERDNGGEVARVYLRSKFHSENVNYRGWDVHGAITSILTAVQSEENQ